MSASPVRPSGRKVAPPPASVNPGRKSLARGLDRAQLQPIDLGPVIALERPLGLSIVDRAPDDDLVDRMLLDVDDVDGAVFRRGRGAGGGGIGLQGLVAPGPGSRALGR